jgi:hypothetical protein
MWECSYGQLWDKASRNGARKISQSVRTPQITGHRSRGFSRINFFSISFQREFDGPSSYSMAGLLR